MLDDTPELKAPAMLERLRARGYTGGISILRERMRKLRPKPAAEAFLTLEFAPGSAMQVDWADFGFVLPGVPRRVSAFVATLCYSRHLYIEFTVSQRMGTFLRCMERALDFFGGTANADIFDNMRTVVLEHTRSHVVFNPRMLEYARARGGFALVACNPRKGNEKGIVERGIGFVRSRFWPGRRFTSLFDLNAQATKWREEFANGREHERTGRIPRLVFENEERPLLKAVPDVPFRHRRPAEHRREQELPRALRPQHLLGTVAPRQPVRARARQRRRSLRVARPQARGRASALLECRRRHRASISQERACST